MKFSCTQENLNQGLNIVSHIASKNAALPILNNVLIKVQNGVIKLITTNLEIGIEKNIRGKIEKEGEFTIDARLLNEFIGLLAKNRVDLEKIDQDLIIESQNSKTKIKGLLAEDFPILPQIDKKEGGVCENNLFKKALNQVIFAAANDETKPEISGVFFNFNQGNLTLAATDSYRLAEKIIKLKKYPPQDKTLIIPTKTLQELVRVLNEETEDSLLEIYLGENQVLFCINETNLISRLIEGQYPDYRQIIPTQYKTQVVLDSSELIKIIKRTSLFCKTGINDLNLKFLPKGNEVVISAANLEVGENTSQLSAEIKGEENEIVFNWRYLLDGINNIQTNEVILEIIDSAYPGILKSEKEKDYLYLIMPIRQ